jgi:hypothetical protein
MAVIPGVPVRSTVERVCERLARRYGALSDSGDTVIGNIVFHQNTVPMDRGSELAINCGIPIVLQVVLNMDDESVTPVCLNEGSWILAIVDIHLLWNAIRGKSDIVDSEPVLY